MNWQTALFLAGVSLFALSFIIAICGMIGLAIHDWFASRVGRLISRWRLA